MSAGGGPATSGGTGDASDGGSVGEDGGPGSGDPAFDVGGGEGPPGFPTTCDAAQETPTSVGCEFYPLTLPGDSGPPFGAHMAFVVSNVSTEEAYVVLSNSSGEVDAMTVAAGEVDWFLDPGQQVGPGLFDSGFVLESDRPIQVFSLKPPELVETNDATIVLPKTALGTTHRVFSYNDRYNTSRLGAQWVVIEATEDDTAVTFTLADEATRTYEGNVPSAELPLDGTTGPTSITKTLARFETLMIAADNSHPVDYTWTNQLTGSLVQSDKPVAVYSGSDCSFAPEADNEDGVVPWPPADEWCCCDVLTTAVPPVSTWGTQYVGVKLLARADEVDIWRFIAHEDDTTIQLGGGVDQTIELAAGEYADVETRENFVADGNRAFGLVHMMTGAGNTGLGDETIPTYDCGDLGHPGDPAATWAYPTGNWMRRYVFPSGLARDGTWCQDHATVVATLDDWVSIEFDGEPLPAPTPLAGTEFGFAYVPAEDGTHELIAPPGVGVELTAYGFSEWGSYLYPGGLGLAEINPAG